MELRNRVALVTGGAVRIGRAIVRGLSSEGMRVVVHFHASSAKADALVDEIRAAGREAIAIGANLEHTDEVLRLAGEAEKAFGRVDVLVNNASIFPAERLEATESALWDRVMAVNLRAPFLLCQRLSAGMRERGEGVVVNLADLAGLQPWASYAAHSVAKAGLVHLTRVAARSLAPEVRVVAIAPGTVLPPDDLSADEIERLARLAPLRRNGSPEDVVQALLYLLRADFVTGEVLVVDGGRILR